jgi:hypothetical protein
VRRGCTCAFGSHYSLLRERLRRVGLGVEDYVLCRNRAVVLNDVYIPLTNEVTIDKPRLVHDLCPKPIHRTVDVGVMESRADWVVNATAVPLEPYHLIGTLQFKARASGLETGVNYVYVNPRIAGYAWAFPLDEEGRWFHVGAGCVNADPKVLIYGLLRRYGARIEARACSCNRPIRVVDPNRFYPVRRRVISVGEAGGFVFPITGEGTLPAMDSAELFCEALDMPFWPDPYAFEVHKYFKRWEYDKAFKLWRLIERRPRTAWLMGLRMMIRRSRQRAKPRLSKLKVFEVLARLFLG